jgi:hypothetical protein
MEVIKSYTQSKLDIKKKNAVTRANINLYYEENYVCLYGDFDLNFDLVNRQRSIIFIHEIKINLVTGDVETYNETKNKNLTKERMFRNIVIRKKNDFSRVLDSIENGFIKGEKRKNFWGVKYEKSVEQILITLHEILKLNFSTTFYRNKLFWRREFYPTIYEVIVDFHMDKKKIKAHDNIYNDIQHEYPKKKWLKLNDNKFLPAVLDSYGIKSKYLIGELSSTTLSLKIRSINYICKLFGDNYLDYLKLIPWRQHCNYLPPNKKTHTLKNDSEKAFMIMVMKNWEKNNLKFETFVSLTNKLLSIREDLENKGLKLKFKAKNDVDFDTLLEIWAGHKKHMSRGYRMRYNFPVDFVSVIEEKIVDNGQIFYPTILKTEEDFMLEGYDMRNCMSQQFVHAFNSIYISMKNNRTKVNLQFRKGKLMQQYGKANTPIIPRFEKAINILANRMENFSYVMGIKEKYDFIKHSKS